MIAWMQKAIRMWWVFHHFGFPKEQLKVRSLPYDLFWR
jgi:hypothetical protein